MVDTYIVMMEAPSPNEKSGYSWIDGWIMGQEFILDGMA